MNKLSKRLLSILLSLVMVITAVPAFAVTAQAAATGSADDKLLFAYFCGDDTTSFTVNQKIRLAVSEDGINFSPLNGNLPLLDNTEDGSKVVSFNNMWGKFAHTGGARDPFIINKHDPKTGNIIAGYYVVATDLSVITGAEDNSYNNTKMLVWDVASLDNINSIKPWVIETAGMFNDNNVASANNAIAWAPEVTWDYTRNQYAMIWSGPLYSGSRINVAYTSDFQTFNTSTGATINGTSVIPETLMSVSGGNCIDANVNYENGKYYMIFKREDSAQKGILYYASATTLIGLASQTPTLFKVTGYNTVGKGLEGPEIYKRADGHWVLIADDYSRNPICNFVMIDLGTSLETGLCRGGDYDHAQDLVTTSNINSVNPRHGGMALISNDEYNALNQAYAGYTPSSPGQLVAQYFTTSNIAEDATGHGYTLSTYNGLTTANGIGGRDNVAFFDNGSNNSNSTGAKYASVGTGQMNTGDHTFTAKDGFTFMWDAYDLGTSGGYDAYANLYNLSTYTGSVGNCNYNETNWPQNSYKLSYVTSQLSGGISNGINSKEGIQRNDGSSPALNGWHSYRAVYGRNGMVVYRDNVKVLSYALDGIDDTWVSDLFGTNGRINIGASLFANDKLFNGYISNFRIYNTSNQQNVARIDYLIKFPSVPITPGQGLTNVQKMMKEFENRMNSDTIFTNVQPAYKKYVAAQAAIDKACETGDGSKLTTAALDLQLAMDDMRPWTMPDTYKGTAVPQFQEGVLKSTDYYSNLLYSVPTGKYSQYQFEHTYSSSTVYYQISNNQTVVLHDGSTETVIPVMFQSVILGKGKVRYNYAVFPTTGAGSTENLTDFYLNKNWTSEDASTTENDSGWNFAAKIAGTKYYVGYANNHLQTGKDMTGGRFNGGWSNRFTYANTMLYNQNTEFVADTTGKYSKKYNLWWCMADETSGKTSFDTLQRITQQTGDNCAIYVVNYKALLDAIKDAQKGVENYKQGGLSDALFTAIENAIAYNPNTAATGAKSAADVVTNFNKSVSEHIDYIEKAQKTPDDKNKTITHARASFNWVTHSVQTCEDDGSETGTCAFCGYVQNNTYPAYGHEYRFDKTGSQYVCQHDAGHTKTVDLTVYDETQILSGLVDKSAYKDSAAIDTAKTALDGVIDAAADDADPQDTIDAAISSMITAINSNEIAEKKTYNVKFYVNIDGVSTQISNSNVPYGRVVTLDANATGLVGGVECYSWTVSTGGTERTFSQPGNTRTLLVQADTVVTAYCSTAERVAKIYNPYNAVLYTVALQIGDTITAQDNVVTVTHSGTPTTYIVGSMPYMVVTGFMLDGQEFREAYTVTADTTQVNIKPIVNKSSAGTYTVTLDGKEVATNVAYDTMVTVNSNSPNPYAIAIKLGDGKYAIAAYGGTYSFYANRSVDFCTVTKSDTAYTIEGSTVTDKTLIYKLNNGLPDVYSGHAVTDGANRVTTFNAITVGCNSNSIVILEAGTIYTTGTATEDTFVLGAEGVKQVVAKNIVNPGNQYSLSIGNGKGKGVKTRAYVRYSYTKSTGETVEAITYGNVCVLA